MTASRVGRNDLVGLVLLVCCAIAGGGLSANAGEVLRSEAKPSTETSAGRFNGKIVFSSDRHNSSLSLWSMNADGSSPTRLTDGRSRGPDLPSYVHVYDVGPVWSPDGSKIAFSSNRNFRFGLYTMNADGSNVRLITDEVPDPGGAAWSPDGSRIAFTAGYAFTIDTKPVIDIYVINVDGSGLTKLTQASAENYGPTWSPDSKQIAFASNRETDWHIWVMNAVAAHSKSRCLTMKATPLFSAAFAKRQ